MLCKLNKLPILVGGTFYWLESLLWDNYLNQHDVSDNEIEKEATKEDLSKYLPLFSLSNEDILKHKNLNENLWSKLNKIDPIMANKLHPNNLRRIQLSLDIYKKTGQKHSDILLQKGELRGNQTNYQICILWLYNTLDIIKERITKRIDQMVQNGLKNEIRSFYLLLKEKYLQLIQHKLIKKKKYNFR